MTKKLVSPLGWTRYFFNDPRASKPALNSAVAHSPQNLSVSIINKVLYDIADIVQDSFINAYQHLNDCDCDLKFSSWLYRIVHNQTINFYNLNHYISYISNR